MVKPVARALAGTPNSRLEPRVIPAQAGIHLPDVSYGPARTRAIIWRGSVFFLAT
jgi:hypothetical protein